ncbi:uncharacterized protein LOC133792670 [Humulus lupulus]|uniref:uncharacterized protein LOC133792670 n=1 Tax=Humulus lupulus TaxID=3486 RepID=UPI002B40B2C0|nr:uncharacterized protein LOC133792670 [Humulus lupulus]
MEPLEPPPGAAWSHQHLLKPHLPAAKPSQLPPEAPAASSLQQPIAPMAHDSPLGPIVSLAPPSAAPPASTPPAQPSSKQARQAQPAPPKPRGGKAKDLVTKSIYLEMDIRRFFIVAIVCALSYYCKAEEQPIKLSKDEVIEIENRLERLNKSSVKTIKVQSGDIYDCVDFYKQPAFDHPLLKNHNYDFQMRPSSRPKMMDNENQLPKNVKQISIDSESKGERCPTGTVPIRRSTKEDLIRAKLFTKAYSSRIIRSQLASENDSFHHAMVRTKSDPAKKYNGGGTFASFYTLPNVGDSQYTAGRMKIHNELDIIQAGWTVNPAIYGDNKNRIFVYFQAGEFSCFNTMCPGFVLVDPRPINDLILGEAHPGYWPSSIFSGGLKDLATYVEWGGETYSPPGQVGPPMGSGLLLRGDSRYDAYCRVLTTINEAHIQEDAKNTEKIKSIYLEMDIRGFFIVAIVCAFLYYCKAEEQPMKLSKDEVLEIENRLERLNKSSVKTIKVQSGDIYDCVDFYKQPAFDHPSLKNHNYNFQTKPSYRPKVMMNEKESPYWGRQVSLKSGFKGKSCPIGTVPIRRHTKEELVRAKLFTKTYSSRISPLAPEAEGFHHAIVRTKSNPNKKYNGASTSASFYTLDNVTGSQYTSGQMTIQNGDDSIRVGWTVNPTLYGDHKSRLFAFFKAGGLSCFNTMCPGFVIVRTDIPLDDVLPEKHPGGFAWEYNFFVYRDRTTGNWWLELGIYNIPIGYWPSSIFSSGLKDLATYIDWGGETYSPVGQPGPPMGSGLFLKGDTRYDAYCRKLTTVNEAHDPEDAKNTEKVSIDIDFYLVQDWGFVGKSRRLMTYGGPGPR